MKRVIVESKNKNIYAKQYKQKSLKKLKGVSLPNKDLTDGFFAFEFFFLNSAIEREKRKIKKTIIIN